MVIKIDTEEMKRMKHGANLESRHDGDQRKSRVGLEEIETHKT